MHHCSSEREEEQFESMVGGAAAEEVEDMDGEETEAYESEDEEDQMAAEGLLSLAEKTPPSAADQRAAAGLRSLAEKTPMAADPRAAAGRMARSKSNSHAHSHAPIKSSVEKGTRAGNEVIRPTKSLLSQSKLRSMPMDRELGQLLNVIAKFNRKYQSGAKTPNSSHGLRVYCVVKDKHTIGYRLEWLTIPEYVIILEESGKYPPGHLAFKEAREDDLNHSINQMIGDAFGGMPVDDMPKLNNILASIILETYEKTERIYLEGQIPQPASGSLPPQDLDERQQRLRTSLRQRTEAGLQTMISIGNNIYYYCFQNFLNRMMHNIGEDTRDYTRFSTQNFYFMSTILTLIGKINIPPGIFHKFAEYIVQTGLITYLIELIKRYYDADISIKSYALAGIIVFIVKCAGVVVRTLTPSDNFIQKIGMVGNVTIEGINSDLQILAKDRSILPIPQTIAKLLLLRQYYESDINNAEAASRSFNIASIQLCDSIISALYAADKATEEGVKSVNIENAKKLFGLFITFTTGHQSVIPFTHNEQIQQQQLQPVDPAVLARPQGVQDAEEEPEVRQELTLLARPRNVQGPPGLGATPPVPGVGTGTPTPPVPGAGAGLTPSVLGTGSLRTINEEKEETKSGEGGEGGEGGEEMEVVTTQPGGAAKRTTKKRSKKVKTKMLKGKSKKHLKKSKKDKKSKKGKKTGKKRVRFHSSSKKSKKSTRKRR